jgi:hypothetical protein
MNGFFDHGQILSAISHPKNLLNHPTLIIANNLRLPTLAILFAVFNASLHNFLAMWPASQRRMMTLPMASNLERDLFVADNGNYLILQKNTHVMSDSIEPQHFQET